MKSQFLLMSIAPLVAACSLLACSGDGRVEQDGILRDECDAGDPEEQRWGTDCQCCHDDQFGVAASVSKDAEVARIMVTDGTGQAAGSPNMHGNFFRHVQLMPPLSASLMFEDGHVVSMKEPAPHGACNRCHDGEQHPRLGDVR